MRLDIITSIIFLICGQVAWGLCGTPDLVKMSTANYDCSVTASGFTRYNDFSTDFMDKRNENQINVTNAFYSEIWFEGRFEGLNLNTNFNYPQSNITFNTTHQPGLINGIPSSDFTDCEIFNRVWKVSNHEINKVKEGFTNNELNIENIPVDILECQLKAIPI